MLKQEPARPLTKTLLDEASKKAASLLMEFAKRHSLRPEKEALSEEVPAMPNSEAKDTLFDSLLSPWFLYLWYPLNTPDDEPMPSDQTVAARFLKEEGNRLDGVTRRYIEAARLEPFSFWQVLAVSPSESILLKDMITDTERVVHDRCMTRAVPKWDIVFAQVVGLDGFYVFNALAPCPLPPSRFRHHILSFIDKLKRMTGPHVKPGTLLSGQGEIVSLYLTFLKEVLNPILPQLVNMDGDKLVFAKSQYEFAPEHRPQVIATLLKIPGMKPDGEESGMSLFAWVEHPENAARKEIVTKARLVVGAHHLETECNSEKRDKALRTKLLARCGDVLAHVSTNLQPFNPGKHPSKDRNTAATGSKSLDLATLPPEARSQIESVLESKYMSWADENVPMLGGKTPRQAVKTPEGREQVAGMINDWENMGLRNPHPQFQFDFNKLRSALGIEPE